MEPRIHSVIRLMTDDLKRETSLEGLARSVNLSVFRLHHLFKEETGASPLQYLKTQRLLTSRDLLENTFLNLKEVMSETGFSDRSHFARDFKKEFGLSPLQHRQQHLLAKQRSKLIARTATV